MKKSSLKISLVLFVFFIFSFCSTSFTYAAGKGEIKPLSFVSCTLDDGSNIDDPNGITLQPKFTLLFDKNVVDMLVWNNNRNCINLSTDDNANVPIDVSKIDDTVDFDHRQQIFVSPSSTLKPDKVYHIYIFPNLTAKNGVATLGGTTDGKGITITFKTQKQEVEQNTNDTSTTNQNDTQQNTEGSSEGQTNEGSTPVAVTNTTNEDTTSEDVVTDTNDESTTNEDVVTDTADWSTTNEDVASDTADESTTTGDITVENTTNAVVASNTISESKIQDVSQNSSQVTTSDTPKAKDNKEAEDNKKVEVDKNVEASSKVTEETVADNSKNETVKQSQTLMGKSTSEDSSVKWMYFITGTILILWIVTEVIFKTRRIRERRNNHLGKES